MCGILKGMRFCGEVAVGGARLNVVKLPVAAMSLRVARGVYNPESDRFHFYVSFKPTLDPTAEERGSEAEYKIDVAVSVTETGELADLAFTLPELCRNRRCLDYISRTHSASVIDDRVFVTVPGLSGDSVLEANGILELDGAGKIMGVEIS
ncbi:MAG TPA: hypothetical protein VJN64_16090 [Terriglobales bacterium]|nr:hypothetical protein [Terriglobales bacterium]